MTSNSPYDWRDELFKEKNLWAIYRKSPGIAATKFNLITTVCVFMCLTLIGVLHERSIILSILGPKDLAKTLADFADISFVFSITILGFLIAGFTIFASTTRPQLFLEMAQLQYKNTELSQLKYVFSTIINVFIHYIMFTSVCMIILMVLGENAVGRHIVKILDLSQSPLVGPGLKLLLVLFLTWLCVVILKLKSFVWNVYQFVLLAIACESLPKNEG